MTASTIQRINENGTRVRAHHDDIAIPSNGNGKRQHRSRDSIQYECGEQRSIQAKVRSNYMHPKT